MSLNYKNLENMENIVEKKSPNLIQMLRAPFFSSILAPVIAGVVAAVVVNKGEISVEGLILVLIMGIGLHAATNVYNDIYDTIQGTDKVNVHRNEFSGGSGILVDSPELMPKMYNIARISLIIALGACTLMFSVIDKEHYWVLASLYLLSAFFAKYYTAAPVKLAYRGLGEISVWFAFGPMAILVGALSQNVTFEPLILWIMPLTGLSTLSILWLGQMIDLPADEATGKRGLVARLGTKITRWGYLIIQLIAVVNIIAVPLFVPGIKFSFYGILIPFGFYLYKIIPVVIKNHDNPDGLKPAAKLNVMLHLVFSLFFILALFFQI